ncbi:alpha/beta fold hydrolase [Streptosporangium lutulentum]
MSSSGILLRSSGRNTATTWFERLPVAQRHATPRRTGQLIACDLVGMGDSGKLPSSGPDRYSYREQRDHLFALWEHLGIGDDAVLVLHDWGSALGFDWAFHNQDRVAGIAYMEAIVAPLTWDDWQEHARPTFQALRSPRRIHGDHRQRVRRAGDADGDPPGPERGGESGLPSALPHPGREPSPHAELAARSRSTANPPTWCGSSRSTADGWPRPRCPNCSSTPTPAPS